MLGDAPFAVFKPVVEELLADKDQDKQRAAAELLAGIIGGIFFHLAIDRNSS